MSQSLDNIEFLLDSINLDEFRIQCDIWRIDFMEAVDKLSIYQTAALVKCLPLDHLYWISRDGKEVPPPSTIDGPLMCSHTNITSLAGSPREVKHGFFCIHTQIKTLKGGPERVGGEFNCSSTEITTLKGAPQEIGRNFICAMNSELVSLDGGPRAVGGCFDCQHTAISSLDGAPSYIGSSLYCRVGTHISKEQEKEYIKGCHRLSISGIESWKKAHIDSTGHYREVKRTGKEKEKEA